LGDIKVYHNEIMSKIRLLKNIHLELTPEISAGGRWHYHGYVTIKDIANFLLYDLKILKQYFSFELDTIGETEEDKKKWFEYVTKCSHFMEKYSKESKIPYPIDSNTKDVKTDKLQEGLKYSWVDTFAEDGTWIGQHKVGLPEGGGEA